MHVRLIVQVYAYRHTPANTIFSAVLDDADMMATAFGETSPLRSQTTHHVGGKGSRMASNFSPMGAMEFWRVAAREGRISMIMAKRFVAFIH
jgi:hypothetical protein